MKTSKGQKPAKAGELRWGAEEILDRKRPSCRSPRSDDALQKLVHELEVHQVELEMQNAELRRTYDELEISRNKFSELYDFAPVGYFTFDRHGIIKDVNLTATEFLGIERRLLADTPFSNFIVDAEGREVFFSHLESVLNNQGLHKCEIKLKAKGGTVIHGQIQSVMVATCSG